MRRREDIRKFWFFDCKCKRCSDSTELGSYMSAVTCFACKRGFLLPISALEYKSDWQCDHCQNVVPYDLVNEVISTIESQVKFKVARQIGCVINVGFTGGSDRNGRY